MVVVHWKNKFSCWDIFAPIENKVALQNKKGKEKQRYENTNQ